MAEGLEVWRRHIRSTERKRNAWRRGHWCQRSRVDGLGPGKNGVGMVHRQCRGAKCVADRGTFLFGKRWEHKEGELGSSINFKDNK